MQDWLSGTRRRQLQQFRAHAGNLTMDPTIFWLALARSKYQHQEASNQMRGSQGYRCQRCQTKTPTTSQMMFHLYTTDCWMQPKHFAMRWESWCSVDLQATAEGLPELLRPIFWMAVMVSDRLRKFTAPPTWDVDLHIKGKVPSEWAQGTLGMKGYKCPSCNQTFAEYKHVPQHVTDSALCTKHLLTNKPQQVPDDCWFSIVVQNAHAAFELSNENFMESCRQKEHMYRAVVHANMVDIIAALKTQPGRQVLFPNGIPTPRLPLPTPVQPNPQPTTTTTSTPTRPPPPVQPASSSSSSDALMQMISDIGDKVVGEQAEANRRASAAAAMEGQQAPTTTASSPLPFDVPSAKKQKVGLATEKERAVDVNIEEIARLGYHCRCCLKSVSAFQDMLDHFEQSEHCMKHTLTNKPSFLRWELWCSLAITRTVALAQKDSGGGTSDWIWKEIHGAETDDQIKCKQAKLLTNQT
eukprot:TRINITY_DN20687_c0_g1_i1.p1 TRINITY_DN20687_c0_g1~~TRINITY_DN20687_c0_g1_i1.p1  ORF type:complete len:535 (-),score=47.00 TRINITY_DN20687_c0_g1_i1:23-1426(-)